MIVSRLSEFYRIDCDRCAHSFTGDYDEPRRDVIEAARDCGWEIYEPTERAVCPRCFAQGRQPAPHDDPTNPARCQICGKEHK